MGFRVGAWGFRFWAWGFGFWVSGFGFRDCVLGCGYGITSLACKVQASKIQSEGLGFCAQGSRGMEEEGGIIHRHCQANTSRSGFLTY